MHRGQCYGANGGDAESHHNCGGACRNAHIKSNPYQSDAGYGGYIGYNINGCSATHPRNANIAAHNTTDEEEDTDDGIIYMPGPSSSKKQPHYFHAAPMLNAPEKKQRGEQSDGEEQVEQEHEEDYDEDIPPIDLSKAPSVESFATKVQTEKGVNADGAPFTVTTIL